MTKQITIIGLGQIGASVGLALAPYKSSIKRVGHDKAPGTARSAQALGAVDEINFNLPASVREADIVLLAVPFSELEETFKFIGNDLKQGAVVLDSAPLKAKAAEWAEKYIPSGRSYVGLVPSIGPDHLLNVGAGQSAAQADLFHQALFLVCPARNTDGAGVKRVTDLLELLGASPLFSDPLEADGLMAALHTLPQLMSLSLLNATVKQPGWQEARKMASRPYGLAAAAALYLDQAEAVVESMRFNRLNVMRVLDNAIRSLTELRAALDEEDLKSAGELVDDAYLGGMQWLKDRLGADWEAEDRPPIEIASFSERLLGTWLQPRKQK